MPACYKSPTTFGIGLALSALARPKESFRGGAFNGSRAKVYGPGFCLMFGVREAVATEPDWRYQIFEAGSMKLKRLRIILHHHQANLGGRRLDGWVWRRSRDNRKCFVTKEVIMNMSCVTYPGTSYATTAAGLGSLLIRESSHVLPQRFLSNVGRRLGRARVFNHPGFTPSSICPR